MEKYTKAGRIHKLYTVEINKSGIRSVIFEQGMNQKKLAELAGVSYESVGRACRRGTMGYGIATKIFKALGYQMNEAETSGLVIVK